MKSSNVASVTCCSCLPAAPECKEAKHHKRRIKCCVKIRRKPFLRGRNTERRNSTFSLWCLRARGVNHLRTAAMHLHTSRRGAANTSRKTNAAAVGRHSGLGARQRSSQKCYRQTRRVGKFLKCGLNSAGTRKRAVQTLCQKC